MKNCAKNGTQSATHFSFFNDTSDAPNITSPVLYQGAQQRE